MPIKSELISRSYTLTYYKLVKDFPVRCHIFQRGIWTKKKDAEIIQHPFFYINYAMIICSLQFSSLILDCLR